MKNIDINFKIMIWRFINEQSDQEIVIDAQDAQFYYCKQNGGGVLELTPYLDPTHPPIIHYDENNLIFVDDLLSGNISKYQQLSGLYQAHISQLSVSNQGNAQNNISIHTDNNSVNADGDQQDNSQLSEIEQKLIGKGKADLVRFSQNYKGTIADTAFQIENLINIILKNTEKRQTISKTIEDYHLAIELSKQGNLFELTELRKKLEGRRVSQGTIIQTKQNIQDRKTRNERVRFLLIMAAVFIPIVIFISYYNRTKINTSQLATNTIIEESNNKEKKQVQKQNLQTESTHIYTREEVINLILDYEQKKQKQLSDWRKSQIVKSFFNQNLTEKQAINQVSFEAEKKY